MPGLGEGPTLWFPATHFSCQLWYPCHGPSHIFQEMQGTRLVGPGLCVHLGGPYSSLSMLFGRVLALPGWEKGDLAASFVGGGGCHIPLPHAPPWKVDQERITHVGWKKWATGALSRVL